MIDQEFINKKLIEIGSILLIPKYRKLWTKENPTSGYCYIVSEVIYHFESSKESYSMCLNLGNMGVHWWIIDNNKIIDFTGNQFDFVIDYNKGKKKNFLKGSIETNKGYISKRGYELYKIFKG